jgi:AraC-like DNA-binding protein
VKVDRQWSIGHLPPRDRFAAWLEILSTAYLPFAADMVPLPGGDFAADVRESKLGPMSLVRASISPHRGRRTRRPSTANSGDVIELHVIESGRMLADRDGERVVLAAGDAMIWDGATTGDYEIVEPLVKTSLVVPRSLAATALPNYRRSFTQTLPRDHPPTRSLTQVLSVLAEHLPAMSEGAREASALLVTELLKPLDRLRSGDDAEPTRWTMMRLRERALGYIDANLRDPALSPARIAAAHAVSVRALYAAMDGFGMTLGGYIRDRRLASSRDDLLFGSDPVAMVAARWGFASPAHFSRVFHDRYGMSPSTIRRRRG